MLGVNGATDSKGRVELYEKGYGKDAAGIAKEAIAYGAVAQFKRVAACFRQGLIGSFFAQPKITTSMLFSLIQQVECRTTKYVHKSYSTLIYDILKCGSPYSRLCVH